jgi:hypothetical protein
VLIDHVGERGFFVPLSHLWVWDVFFVKEEKDVSQLIVMCLTMSS